MALTDEQRGPRAAYLYRHRKRQYGTGDGGLQALAAAMKELGFDRSWQTYKGYESSDERSPIPPEAEPYFEELFNEPVPQPKPPAPTQAELVAAIWAQTNAITDLAAALRDLTGLEVAPDTAEVAEARRIIREHYLASAARGEQAAAGRRATMAALLATREGAT